MIPFRIHHIILALTICSLTRVSAQFNKGTRLVGPTVAVYYQDVHNIEGMPLSLEKTTLKALYQTYTLIIPYSYCRKENSMVTAGISYTWSRIEERETTVDTNLFASDYTFALTNRPGIILGVAKYLPLGPKGGFYHAENFYFVYGYSTRENQATRGNTTIYNTVPSHEYKADIIASLGGYLRISTNLMAVAELEIIGLGVRSITREGFDNSGQPVNQSTMTINSSGALSPQFNMSNISIGLKFILPPPVQ